MVRKSEAGRLDGRMAIVLAIIGAALLLFPVRGCFYSLPWMNRINMQGISLTQWGWPGWHAYGLLGIWGLIQIVLAVWVGVDANRRGHNGILWGLLVLVTPIIGLIVYLLVVQGMAQRIGAVAATPAAAPAAAPAAVPPEKAGPRCPGCGATIDSEFKVCPYCEASLACNSCGKKVQPDWLVCPYCRTAIARPEAG